MREWIAQALGCVVAFLDHWQTLVAGVLGIIAAIIAVVLTLSGERRKRQREFKVLRRSLGMEMRQYMGNAYKAHLGLRELLDSGAPMPALMVEDRAKLPASAIYPHVAARIAEFGERADQIVLFFNKVTAAREAAESLARHPNQENLPRDEVADAAEAMIEIAATGLPLLSILRTDVPSDIGTDAQATTAITTAMNDWHNQQ